MNSLLSIIIFLLVLQKRYCKGEKILFKYISNKQTKKYYFYDTASDTIRMRKRTFYLKHPLPIKKRTNEYIDL